MLDPSLLYCTDEDIKVRASGDYDMLVPSDQVIVSGTDGTIAAGSWSLTSASVDFVAAGLSVGNVFQLTLTGHASPAHFGVSLVAPRTVDLKRIGMALGMPPVAFSASAVTFGAPTFRPQIEDASYDLNRRYGIDDTFATHSANYLYDSRELRQACVLTVLMRQYAIESRAREGDFASKLLVVREELSDLLARIAVKFGPLGQAATASGRFGTQIRR